MKKKLRMEYMLTVEALSVLQLNHPSEIRQTHSWKVARKFRWNFKRSPQPIKDSVFGNDLDFFFQLDAFWKDLSRTFLFFPGCWGLCVSRLLFFLIYISFLFLQPLGRDCQLKLSVSHCLKYISIHTLKYIVLLYWRTYCPVTIAVGWPLHCRWDRHKCDGNHIMDCN